MVPFAKLTFTKMIPLPKPDSKIMIYTLEKTNIKQMIPFDSFISMSFELAYVSKFLFELENFKMSTLFHLIVYFAIENGLL